MIKKNKADETNQFHQLIKDVSAISQDKYHLRSPKKKKMSKMTAVEKPLNSIHQTKTLLDYHLGFDECVPENIQELSAEDCLHFVRGGLQHKLVQRLNRGQIVIEACLDLHHLTVNQAIETVTHFIELSIQAGHRWILIIHGKGSYSKNRKPILKSMLNYWLKNKHEVLAFHSAQPKDGGKGAVYVLLKKR